MSGVLDTIAAASPIRKSVTLCLDGALQAEWEAVRARLDDAAAADTRRSLADLPATTVVIEEMEALRERMKDSEVIFLFERLPWTERVDLQAKHPPRDKNVVDLMRGYDVATYSPALIRASCLSVTGADGDEVTEIPDESWDGLLGKPAEGDEPAVPGSLNFKQVELLVSAAHAVNDGVSAVPPSARSLLENRDSGASLAQPSPGQAPHPSDSEGGSPRGSRKSSTTKKATSKGKSAGT